MGGVLLDLRVPDIDIPLGLDLREGTKLERHSSTLAPLRDGGRKGEGLELTRNSGVISPGVLADAVDDDQVFIREFDLLKIGLDAGGGDGLRDDRVATVLGPGKTGTKRMN